MGNNPVVSRIIKDYCSKFPELGDLTLAKRMYEDNKKSFNSVEAARSAIRYYRGHSGNENRKYVKPDLKKPLTYDTRDPHLPKSQNKPAPEFKLPSSLKKVLFLSDIHIPYHDETAIEAAVNYGKSQNIDCVWINGDFLDCYQISKHEKDPEKLDLWDEVEMGKEFFAYLRFNFPKATIYYIPGNHEQRLERYISSNAAQLKKFEETKINCLLKLGEQDVIFVPHGAKVYFGKLLVEHGDKLRGTGGVNPARTLALKFKRHSISGHWHRTSEAQSKVYDGETIRTFTVGCLCDLEPAYLPVNEHNFGFAVIEMKGDEFIVSNKIISDGRVY